MKKKIFLVALMISVLALMLAITSFANDIVVSRTEDAEYGTVIQLNADPGLENAAQYVSTLKKINNASTDIESLTVFTDGTYYYVFPSSYINIERNDGKLDLYAGTAENPGLAQAMAEFNDAMGTSYYESYVLNGSYTDRRIDEIVRFTFPKDVTSMSDSYCCIRSYPKLVEIKFTSVLNLSGAGDTFKNCASLTTVVGFENMDPTLFKSSIFIGCIALESIKLPTSITRIPTGMFTGCGKLRIENLNECTQLTTIGSSAFKDAGTLVFTLPDSVTTIESEAFRSAFQQATASFTINSTSKLVTIGESAFNDCRYGTSRIYIPSTVTSIGKDAFIKNYNLVALDNFENCKVKTIENGTFSYTSSLKALKLPRTVTTIGTAFADNNNLTLVYIPDSVTSIANTFTGGKPTNAVFIYTGTNTDVFENCDKLSGANIIPASAYVPGNSYTGINIVVGYSNCLAYNNGNHEATEIKSIDFTSYEAPITVHYECLECNMEAPSKVIGALFTCVGYSIPDGNRTGIALSYSINTKGIEEYEELTNNTVEYGVFAVSKAKLGENEIFGEDGAKANGVINTDITSYKFGSVTLKILGFDGYESKEFALGVYVKSSDKYSYLQNGEIATGDKYVFTSYNAIIDGIGKKNEVA